MSSKQSTSKQDSRIAKKEVMVTRHKSAQMKRQLRVKDRSMKHLTDLLKSPTREAQTNQPAYVPKNTQKPKTPPKLKQSLLKSVEKVQNLPEKVFKLSKVLRKKVTLVEDVEFYPNKRKRTLDVKKVVLKPNNELQMVASIVGSVKRKCRVPHKASSKKASREASPVYSQLTMAEIISIMEDDLTDEDLMEILTCPSPVWWEDGPGEEYIEEAVFRRTPEPPEPKKEDVKMDVDEEKKVEAIKIPNLNKKSEKFLKKRSKLEGLLGNIKNKNNKSENLNNDDKDKVVSCKNVFNEDLVVICSNYRNGKSNNNETRNRTKSDSDSDEYIFHDISMNEDELLRSLENMEIPIETTKQIKLTHTDTHDKTDVIVIDDDDDDILEVTTFDIKKEKSKRNNDNDKNKVNYLKTTNDALNVPENMPVLMKFDSKEAASPKSFDSCSSKVSAASQELDSISDTNVKFILDDEMDENKMTINVSDEKAVLIKKTNIEQESSKETNVITKNITSYRIVDDVSDRKPHAVKNIVVSKEKTSQDDEDDKSAKINDYYKKCKKVYQKKDKTDLNKNEFNKNQENCVTKFMFCESCLPKTKNVVKNKNVKLCMKCSCVFDTAECTFCLENSKFTCQPCNTKFCCEVQLDAHKTHVHTLENNGLDT